MRKSLKDYLAVEITGQTERTNSGRPFPDPLRHRQPVNNADGETRTRKACATRPSSVRVYQFHHIRVIVQCIKKYTSLHLADLSTHLPTSSSDCLNTT